MAVNVKTSLTFNFNETATMIKSKLYSEELKHIFIPRNFNLLLMKSLYKVQLSISVILKRKERLQNEQEWI